MHPTLFRPPSRATLATRPGKATHVATATLLAFACLIGLAGTAPRALADTPASLQAGFASEAKAADPRFAGFSAERGRQFFASRHGGDWSCTSCHTDNPAAGGAHKVTNKPIDPLAPAANPERFTRADKVEKWFKRNCNDVLKRACSAQEKGDVLAYLLTVRR